MRRVLALCVPAEPPKREYDYMLQGAPRPLGKGEISSETLKQFMEDRYRGVKR